MRKPHEWFPKAREMKRKIIYHYGPTNSGKTMTSLQSLLKSKKGIYCAPLRLLAWEIYEKINSLGKKVSLLTGEERRVNPDSEILSCTIEMASLEQEYDVAIIVVFKPYQDEIQLINDSKRGSAWSNAFLGLCAKEVHLCGDERALHLIARLCLLTGDSVNPSDSVRSDRVQKKERAARGKQTVRARVGPEGRGLSHFLPD